MKFYIYILNLLFQIMSSFSNITESEGITKLINNQTLIIKYFESSQLLRNYMNIRCSKVFIPGKEIGQKSSFYLYNIEGFFDIEKGFYFSLIKLLESMIILKKCEIKLKSYEDLETKYSLLFKALEMSSSLVIMWSGNTNKNENQQDNEENKECFSYKESEKVNESNISFECPAMKFNYENKNKQKDINFCQMLNECKNYCKENCSLNKSNYIFSVLKYIIAKLENSHVNGDSNCKSITSWLKGVISFEELNGFISIIENGFRVFEGIYNISEGIKEYSDNKLFSIFRLINGGINIIKGIYFYVKLLFIGQKEKNDNQLTNAQINFRILLNKIDELMENLTNSNLEELKNNNIIILEIDDSNNSKESVYLKLVKIEKLDHYARCLKDEEQKRINYISNMIYFYSIIVPELNITNNEQSNLKELEEKKDYLIFVQDSVKKELNTKDIWIELTKSKIENFINEKREKYYNDFSNYAEELNKPKKENKKSYLDISDAPAPTIN